MHASPTSKLTNLQIFLWMTARLTYTYTLCYWIKSTFLKHHTPLFSRNGAIFLFPPLPTNQRAGKAQGSATQEPPLPPRPPSSITGRRHCWVVLGLLLPSSIILPLLLPPSIISPLSRPLCTGLLLSLPSLLPALRPPLPALPAGLAPACIWVMNRRAVLFFHESDSPLRCSRGWLA